MMSRVFPAVCIALTMMLAAPVLAADSGGGGGSGVEQPGRSAFDEGRKLIEQKRYADAIVSLKKAVVAQSANADYLTELAYASRKAGQRDASFEYYAAALKADPDHIGAMNYLRMLYVETDRPHKAQELLQRIDDECFFTCDEYSTLKAAIESGDASAY